MKPWKNLTAEERAAYDNGVGPWWLPAWPRAVLTRLSGRFFQEADWAQHDYGYAKDLLKRTEGCLMFETITKALVGIAEVVGILRELRALKEPKTQSEIAAKQAVDRVALEIDQAKTPFRINNLGLPWRLDIRCASAPFRRKL